MDKKFRRKYKALMLDVDGTLITNEKAGKISKKVRDTILKTRSRINIGIASGRPLDRATFVFDELKLKKPCIISGGAQIVNPVSRKVLWEKAILQKDVRILRETLSRLPNKVWVVDGTKEVLLRPHQPLRKPLSFFVPKISEFKANALIRRLNTSSLGITKVVAYHEGYVALHITHARATKKYGVIQAAKILGVEYKDIIGVGDGYNDYSLFNACGLKIAIGNAVNGLKARADYIAPSVQDDGVAHVIEKFVINYKVPYQEPS